MSTNHAETLPGIIIFALFAWAWLPCKHPCDYNSYRDWWHDRENWWR